MKRRLIAVFAVLLLSGCASTDVAKDYRLGPDSKVGVVTGSVSYSGRFSGYGVFYRQLPSGASGTFETGSSMALLPFPDKGDFDQKDLSGTVFAAALPPGDYEIYSWSVGSGPATVEPTMPFSIRFKVESGRLVYLGNFHFRQTAGMGLTVTGVNVSYRDSATRDLPIFRTKFPNLASASISSSVATGFEQQNLGGPAAATIQLPLPVPVRR